MKIDIISDTVCPWCYIGKRRLERALPDGPQVDLTIEWRPFQLNPDMPADGMEREDYLAAKFGNADAAGAVYEPILEAGREEGIDFAFEKIVRTPNTLNSHRLIRRAGDVDCQDAVVEGLFRAYFIEGGDIGDIDLLADIAADAGMDGRAARAYLESETDMHDVRAEDVMARQSGVQGVPFFILERKYAISGAQPPEVFRRAFELLAEAAETGDTAPPP